MALRNIIEKVLFCYLLSFKKKFCLHKQNGFYKTTANQSCKILHKKLTLQTISEDRHPNIVHKELKTEIKIYNLKKMYLAFKN